MAALEHLSEPQDPRKPICERAQIPTSRQTNVVGYPLVIEAGEWFS